MCVALQPEKRGQLKNCENGEREREEVQYHRNFYSKEFLSIFISCASIFCPFDLCTWLGLSLWVTHNLDSINLVSDPSRTLRLIWIVESLIVTLPCTWFRLNPEQCSYLKALGRGLLALPVGALLNALGAIVLGAPVGIQYVVLQSLTLIL